MGHYTLREGDSIYRLAVWFYYDYLLWPLIYYTNQNIIGSSPFILPTGKKIFIPSPPFEEKNHTATKNDTAQAMSFKYYGIDYYHLKIDSYNKYPIHYQEGLIYKIPALISKIELEASGDLRRGIHVEFDRSS